MKLPTTLIEKAEHGFGLDEIRRAREHIAKSSPQALDGIEHVGRRRRMIAAVGVEPFENAYERYIGENDLLPINYLQLGYQQSRAVGRISYFDLNENKGAVATGFLVSEDLLLTNRHVFPVDDVNAFRKLVQDPLIDFNHEFDVDGRRSEACIFQLDPERFFHSFEPLDLALIAVKPTDQSGRRPLRSQGYLVLNGVLGKAGTGDYASIIQHPQGAEKQVAIRKNEILDLTQRDTIVYASDTAQGSSGAPVFNDQWQVIALHSAGVAKKNRAGQYVDAQGQVIPKVNGKLDGDRLVWESNRGIRVSAIMSYLAEAPGLAAHPLIQALFSPGYTDSRSFAFLSRPLAPERDKPQASVTPSTIVAPRAEPTPLNISISISARGVDVTTTGGAAPSPATAPFALEFEKKYEDELDFSDCDGFDARFMTEYLPMPVPNAKLRKKLAYLLQSPSSYTLKYHHFSSIHHATRRVPVVTGINVHRAYRYAALNVEGSRADKWYRDNRIDYDVQLNDAFYAKSGFDKGHLARREDAEWGYSLEQAKLAADLTCSYANAIPQVPALNRARFGYKGKWGQLETELLEKGIKNEAGKSGRICVFAGPLFDDEDDPVFKGVQVALSFFKVVVWYDGKGKLRTTCYRLSQEKLVGEIEFEALHFDQVFKTFQVPIKTIEAKTGLVFHQSITSCDTSSGKEQNIPG